MNNMKSGYLKVIVMGGLLAFGLFSCKSSKKAADASSTTEEATPTEEVVVEVEETEPTVKLTPVATKEEKLKQELNTYFSAIASAQASATATNSNINEMKGLFASAKVPVLIIIHESAAGEVDYDEPTNIINYMNYLKDQKKNLNKVHEFKQNADGKITELVLIRK